MIPNKVLKESGYISATSVKNIIAKDLYGENWQKERYNNYAEYSNIVNMVIENLTPFKTGDGKATRYYYYYPNVMSVFESLKKSNFNMQENTELYGDNRDKRKKYLEKNGYVSGVKVKERLWKFIRNSYINDSFTIYHRISKEFPIIFKEIYGEESCKKLGVGSSTRYYFLGNCVDALFTKDIKKLNEKILKLVKD